VGRLYFGGEREIERDQCAHLNKGRGRTKLEEAPKSLKYANSSWPVALCERERLYVCVRERCEEREIREEGGKLSLALLTRDCYLKQRSFSFGFVWGLLSKE
jgi:hypothetical protein